MSASRFVLIALLAAAVSTSAVGTAHLASAAPLSRPGGDASSSQTDDAAESADDADAPAADEAASDDAGADDSGAEDASAGALDPDDGAAADDAASTTGGGSGTSRAGTRSSAGSTGAARPKTGAAGTATAASGASKASPASVTARLTAFDRIRVSWRARKPGTGAARFVVELRSGSAGRTLVVGASARSALFRGVAPGTRFTAHVTAVAKDGSTTSGTSRAVATPTAAAAAKAAQKIADRAAKAAADAAGGTGAVRVDRRLGRA